MSTGHTTYTTFHADSVDEVLKRFTTDPINVSKTMFTALDLVSIQTQTRVQGRKVRRNKSLTEINHYEAENDEINVQDVYQWQAETDEYLKMGDSNTLDAIKFDRGWTQEHLEEELFKREVILAYLIKNGLNTYAEVAATVQAFINDPDTILTLIANGGLEASLEDLREMESVLIDVDQEKEELVPRPDATDETYNLSVDILERAEESLFEEYRGEVPSGLSSALEDVEEADQIEVDRADAEEFDFGGDLDESTDESEWELGDGTVDSPFDAEPTDEPSWLDDEGGFDIEDGAPAGGEAGAKASSGGATRSQPASATDADRPELTAPPSEATPTEEGTSAAPSSPQPSEPDREAGVDDGVGTSSGSTDGEALASSQSPSRDDSEDSIESLFEDMGATLEELETVEESETDPEEGSSEVDELFADQDFGSIFAGDDSMDDPSGDGSAFDDGGEPAVEPEDDDGTESPATDSDTPSSGEPESIFGEISESVFDDDGDDDGGGLFDDAEPSPFDDWEFESVDRSMTGEDDE